MSSGWAMIAAPLHCGWSNLPQECLYLFRRHVLDLIEVILWPMGHFYINRCVLDDLFAWSLQAINSDGFDGNVCTTWNNSQKPISNDMFHIVGPYFVFLSWIHPLNS